MTTTEATTILTEMDTEGTMAAISENVADLIGYDADNFDAATDDAIVSHALGEGVDEAATRAYLAAR